MTELLNGHHSDFSGTNGTFENGTSEECPNGNLKVTKPPRKKVSFHEAVTDIGVSDDANNSLQNGDELLEEDQGGKEDGVDELDNLGDILNISDKINFFKNAFADTKAGHNAGHGQQTSIPEARLAFVTGMVESLSAGNVSRAVSVREEEPYGQEGIVNVASQDGDDDNVEEVLEQTVLDEPLRLEGHRPEILEAADVMAAIADVTYSKIFAPMKHKSSTIEVVDTTSILEHREELRDLWEKRMMADDNQSSPSSTVTEPKSSKPLSEEENEEKILETKSESETKVEQKMSNGFAKPIENNNCENDNNANHVQEKPVENGIISSGAPSSDADQDNNNSADSLEEDNAEEYNEEKTYTSKLEQTLVVKEVKEASESVVESTTEEVKATKEVEVASDAHVSSEAVAADVQAEEVVVEKVDADQPDSTDQAGEVGEVSSSADVHEKSEVVSESVQEIITHEVITSSSSATVKSHEQELVEAFAQAQVKGIEVPDPVDDDGDGFVRLAECIPQVDSSEDISQSEDRDMADEPEISSASIEDHSSRPSSTESSTPTSDIKTPTSNPEIEQFVKSGGVKRIIPGVQKTEQPYSSCTTETKIAMEIREMREREEELRVMREEQALLSPVVSPVPPKSPSPAPHKEAHSPTPSGPGYRVSSVFGQKGTTSPSPPVSVSEEKTAFKLSKESAVEKEIRMARDREEELRKQKGLPPREDDSYVKPSQVKSSQVRVFGKMVGTNNTSLKQAATAKIQLEIEEQTRREMALRETGHIQTISEERTDAKVAKLKPQENGTAHTNGNSHHHTNGTNGNYTNGRSSPDVGPYKRTTPSPTGARPASIFSQNNNAIPKGNISMHKFITSKGKETTFSAARNGGTFIPKEDTTNRAAVPPPMVKLKRNPSVESKIQQEIMEMKQREEELKKLHMRNNDNSSIDGNDMEHEMNQKNNLVEYENGNGINDEELSPRHNKLIAQWEQRIQKAES